MAAALADLEERVSRPLVLIVGMLSTKDSEGFLRNFAGLARRVIAVPIHQDKAVPAAALADIADSIGIPALVRDDVESAIALAGKLDLRSGAAHPDHRLALSCRRGPGRQRHAAGVRPCSAQFGSMPAAFTALPASSTCPRKNSAVCAGDLSSGR